MLEKGYIQLYTGHGKGKTTAALGLALRAAGSGLKSVVIQFMKGQHYGEIDSVRRLGGLIIIEQYGSPEFCKIDYEPLTEHFELAKKGIQRAREVILDKNFSIIILDEIVSAFLFKLIKLSDIQEILEMKPGDKELILTGRGAPKELIEMCDLVTEMKEIRHYYNKGIEARQGIEY